MSSATPPSSAADRGAANLIAVSSVLCGLSLMAAGLRFWARHRQKVSIKADDYFILPALLFKTQMGLTLLSIISLGCTKASILFFYQRIFCVSSRKAVLNVFITASIVLVIAWMVAFEIFTAFQCRLHFNAIWDGTQLKYCDLSYPAMEGLAISDFLLDVWVLALPIYPIMKLHTTKSRRFAIAAVFLLACMYVSALTANATLSTTFIPRYLGQRPAVDIAYSGVASSIARMVEVIKIVQTGQKAIHTTRDPMGIPPYTETQSRIMFYWILEMGIGLVAVNLPSIWMVFASVAPEAILRSIRSVVSLASIGSNGSKRSRERHAEHSKFNKSSSSIAPITSSTADIEAYAMGRREDSADTVPAGEIHVRRSVQQESNGSKTSP
ncbi:hypothetical protein CDD83_2045 [Cordyceps sp. RAO-2017]|nr:hypothetical protein CDD83_2045 [Cordyceps sp. RAO-2017]